MKALFSVDAEVDLENILDKLTLRWIVGPTELRGGLFFSLNAVRLDDRWLLVLILLVLLNVRPNGDEQASRDDVAAAE